MLQVPGRGGGGQDATSSVALPAGQSRGSKGAKPIPRSAQASQAKGPTLMPGNRFEHGSEIPPEPTAMYKSIVEEALKLHRVFSDVAASNPDGLSGTVAPGALAQLLFWLGVGIDRDCVLFDFGSGAGDVLAAALALITYYFGASVGTRAVGGVELPFETLRTALEAKWDFIRQNPAQIVWKDVNDLQKLPVRATVAYCFNPGIHEDDMIHIVKLVNECSTLEKLVFYHAQNGGAFHLSTGILRTLNDARAEDGRVWRLQHKLSGIRMSRGKATFTGYVFVLDPPLRPVSSQQEIGDNDNAEVADGRAQTDDETEAGVTSATAAYDTAADRAIGVSSAELNDAGDIRHLTEDECRFFATSCGESTERVMVPPPPPPPLCGLALQSTSTSAMCSSLRYPRWTRRAMRSASPACVWCVCANTCARAGVRTHLCVFGDSHIRSRELDRLWIPLGTRRMLQLQRIANVNDSRSSLCASAESSDAAREDATALLCTDMPMASPSRSGTPVRVCAHVCAHGSVRACVCAHARVCE
jgi:hypothetical protein